MMGPRFGTFDIVKSMLKHASHLSWAACRAGGARARGGPPPWRWCWPAGPCCCVSAARRSTLQCNGEHVLDGLPKQAMSLNMEGTVDNHC